jgi:hypothetical protein
LFKIIQIVGEVLYEDGNATLVVCKSLLTLNNELNEDCLRTNMFHSIFTIKDKVCNLIIDNVSSDNIVLVEILKIFQIKMNIHPKHYKSN